MKYDKSKHTEAAILAEHKKKERESVKQGKRPFYLKKCNSCVCFVFAMLLCKLIYWPLLKGRLEIITASCNMRLM